MARDDDADRAADSKPGAGDGTAREGRPAEEEQPAEEEGPVEKGRPAEEDRPAERGGPTKQKRRDRADRGDESGGSGFSFTLPPIRLPSFFPADFEFRFPIPDRPRTREVSTGAVLAACLLFDVVDAALALAAPGSIAWVRTVAGTFLAAAFAGPLGAVYAWEVAAALLGSGSLTVVPTLTILVALRALR